MKILNIITLATLLLTCSVSQACPTWQASIENNQPTGWDYALNPQDITVVPNPTDDQQQVIKFTITPHSSWPNGQTRVELKHNGCTTSEGESTFISWEFYLDKPVNTLNHMAYWETDQSYQQSMGLSIEPILEQGEPSNQLAFFSSLPERSTAFKTTVASGQWHKIALAIHWSESKQNGQVSLWLNNKKVLEQLRVQTKPDPNDLFLQLGLHRNQAATAIDSIYLRRVQETSSFKPN